jgi:hypothetical protein
VWSKLESENWEGLATFIKVLDNGLYLVEHERKTLTLEPKSTAGDDIKFFDSEGLKNKINISELFGSPKFTLEVKRELTKKRDKTWLGRVAVTMDS